MATYRYARDSRTNAQKEARQWQVKVGMANAALEQYAFIAASRELTKFEQRNLARCKARLAKLMAENPNEA